MQFCLRYRDTGVNIVYTDTSMLERTEPPIVQIEWSGSIGLLIAKMTLADNKQVIKLLGTIYDNLGGLSAEITTEDGIFISWRLDKALEFEKLKLIAKNNMLTLYLTLETS